MTRLSVHSIHHPADQTYPSIQQSLTERGRVVRSWIECEGERKEGLIDQLKQIHNLLSSVLNEGIKAGIVELVDSKVGDKQLYPYQAYHLFSRKSFHPVSESFAISVLNFMKAGQQLLLGSNFEINSTMKLFKQWSYLCHFSWRDRKDDFREKLSPLTSFLKKDAVRAIDFISPINR